MTLLRKTTTFLQKTRNSVATKELNVRIEVNLNVVTGIGNVLAASSKDVDIDSPNKDANFDAKKVGKHPYVKS